MSYIDDIEDAINWAKNSKLPVKLSNGVDLRQMLLHLDKARRGLQMYMFEQKSSGNLFSGMGAHRTRRDAVSSYGHAEWATEG